MDHLSTAPKFIVIDGHSLLYRAFFGTRFLSTTDGRPTNALFGFVNMLLNLISTERPDGIVVAFDSPAKTFRHAEFADYKAHRKETAPELQQQIPIAKDLIHALDVPDIQLAGYEADDLVGTIALKAQKEGYDVLIVTGDLDALQLVRDGITVIATIRGVTDIHRYDAPAVIERMGLRPDQVADFKALRGDPSDNIPGVPGVGEKTAVKLLLQFDTVENLIERSDEIADEKLRHKIKDNTDQIRQCLMLSTIITDVPIDFEPTQYRPSDQTLAKATAFLEEIEFRSVIRRLPTVFAELGTSKPEAAKPTTELLPVQVNINSDAKTIVKEINTAKSLAIVTLENGIALATSGLTASWISFDLFPPQAVQNAIENPNLPKIAHDVKHQWLRLYEHEIHPQGLKFDSMIAAYLLDSARSSYSIDSLVEDYLNAHLPPITEPENRAAHIAAAIHQLREPMLAKLDKEGTRKVLDEIEIPLIPILVRMEQLGVKVDAEYLGELSERLSFRIEEVASEIYELAKHPFNIGSPKQLGDVLFAEMGLPGGKRTKSGAFTTNAGLLQNLALLHPIAEKIIEWRELSKIKSTYADTLPKLIRADGRVHTTYNLTVASTGRLSSQDPNLQNIPIKSEIGREIRRAFVAEKGYQLLAIDYSQIELRVLAHATGDSVLMQAFEAGLDIHKATAAILFGIPTEQVTNDQRRAAKTVNFAVLYGMSDYGLSQQLRIPIPEAHQIIVSYFNRFPQVKAYLDKLVKQAREVGYTTTLSGRRRYFPELHSANHLERQAAERAATNAPFQGTAADIMKLAMIHIAKYLKDKNTRVLLQVHDELLFESPDNEVRKIAPELGRIMESCFPLNVPLVVDISIGPNWRDMEKLP